MRALPPPKPIRISARCRKEREEIPLLDKAEFQVGDVIEHPAFGSGEIISVNFAGQYYEIDFPRLNGTRQIVFRAQLKKVGK